MERLAGVEFLKPPPPVARVRRGRGAKSAGTAYSQRCRSHDGLASLDNVNLQVELEKRAVVMRSVPPLFARATQGSDAHRSADLFLRFEGDTGVEALRLVATDVVLPLSTEGSGV